MRPVHERDQIIRYCFQVVRFWASCVTTVPQCHAGFGGIVKPAKTGRRGRRKRRIETTPVLQRHLLIFRTFNSSGVRTSVKLKPRRAPRYYELLTITARGAGNNYIDGQIGAIFHDPPHLASAVAFILRYCMPSTFDRSTYHGKLTTFLPIFVYLSLLLPGDATLLSIGPSYHNT